MAYTYSGTISVVFSGLNGLSQYQEALANLEAAEQIANLAGDEPNLTITFDLEGEVS